MGQSLRQYTSEIGQPDFDLEKFAINSLLSATHTAEMDEQDREDIINKVNTAGNDDSEGSDFDSGDGASDNNNGNNDGGNDEFGDNAEFNDNNDEEEMADLEEIQIYETEDLFLDEPKRNNMFQPNSNDILKDNISEGLIKPIKNSIFDKSYLKSKLQESFNQEDMTNAEPQTAPEPIVKPDVKPDTTPVQPSRRNKPFLPMPEVQPDPKANDK